MEIAVLRRFYGRDPSRSGARDLRAHPGVSTRPRGIIFGPTPLRMALPDGAVGLGRNLPRRAVSGVPAGDSRAGLAVAGVLYLLIMQTRIGMWVRAGASDRPIAAAMGVNVPLVFSGLFAVGAAFCRARRRDGRADPFRSGRHGRADADSRTRRHRASAASDRSAAPSSPRCSSASSTRSAACC